VTTTVEVAGLRTGANVLDISSIGAGGGSIAWVDGRGVPQVGPQSAGSHPGPVCYGAGGTEVTVTDAAVVGGFIDPENYLDGRLELDLVAGGIGAADCSFAWTAGLRFTGQVFEVTVPLSDESLTTDGLTELQESFPQHYEELYGKGTAWEGSSVVLVALNLTVTAPRPRPTIAISKTNGSGPIAQANQRRVLLPGGTWDERVACYDGALFTAGMDVLGPAVVDEHDTTLFIGAGWRCSRDAFMNYHLERA
jgi:N-methylhydantoinase A/oxoprolinase/acetone carboxylase beta subunit